MEKQTESLATEMLRELKANCKRWFIVSIIELFIIISIVGIFVWYLNVPEEETTEEITYSQDADTQGDNSSIEQRIGE